MKQKNLNFHQFFNVKHFELNKEDIAQIYGKLESNAWKSYDTGKTLRAWLRRGKADPHFLNFLYCFTVEEVNNETRHYF